MKEITNEKLDKYLGVTRKAISKVTIAGRKDIDWDKNADDFLDMAKRYYRDAIYYREKGDYVTAFAAVNYAHGFLDAGARLGFFDVDNTDDIFAVDKQGNAMMQKPNAEKTHNKEQ